MCKADYDPVREWFDGYASWAREVSKGQRSYDNAEPEEDLSWKEDFPEIDSLPGHDVTWRDLADDPDEPEEEFGDE